MGCTLELRWLVSLRHQGFRVNYIDSFLTYCSENGYAWSVSSVECADIFMECGLVHGLQSNVPLVCINNNSTGTFTHCMF